MHMVAKPTGGIPTRISAVSCHTAASQLASGTAPWCTVYRLADSRRSRLPVQTQPGCPAAFSPVQRRPSALCYGCSSRWQRGSVFPRRLRRTLVSTTSAVAASATAASQAAQTSMATLLISVGIFVMTCAVAAFLICAIPTLLVLVAPLFLVQSDAPPTRLCSASPLLAVSETNSDNDARSNSRHGPRLA